MLTITEFFRLQVQFFSGLTKEQAHSLASRVTQEAYRCGQTIVFKGQTLDSLYVVAEGRVCVLVQEKKGKDWVGIAELGPGEVFGEMSILEMGTTGAMIKSLEDQTVVFIIPQEAFQEILAQSPDFQARVRALIASRKAKS